MRKEEYLSQIRERLRALPQEDVERSLAFYEESIDDRMEDGMSEEEAVASMESPELAAEKLLMDTPLPKLVKARVKHRRWTGLEIVLLVLGAPIWLSLCLAAAAVALSFYVVLWALVLSLGAVLLSLAACVLGGLVGMVGALIQGTLPMAGALLGLGLVCAGLAILMYYLCKFAVRLVISLGRSIVRGIKRAIVRKEETK